MNFIKKNKLLIILILIILAYSIITVLLKKDNSSNDSNSSTDSSTNNTTSSNILIDNISNWEYKNNKWSSLTNDEVVSQNKTYKAFVNNNFLGEYKVLYGTKWNLIDNDQNIKIYNGNLIAYSENFNINIRTVSKRQINSDDEQIIKDNYSSLNISDLTKNEVYELDLDNDGTKDKIIFLSNIDSTATLTSYFKLVFVVLNNEVKPIINETIAPADKLDSKSYYMASILNINNSDEVSIIIGYRYASEAGAPGNC